MKRMNSHTGEHSPEWRTRRPLERHHRSWRPDAPITHPATPDTIPSISTDSKLATEQSYIEHLIQTQPRLATLKLSQFIDSSEILMQPADGFDVDSEIIGEGSQGTIFRARLRNGGEKLVAVKCGWSLAILEEFAMCSQFTHSSMYPVTFARLNTTPCIQTLPEMIFLLTSTFVLVDILRAIAFTVVKDNELNHASGSESDSVSQDAWGSDSEDDDVAPISTATQTRAPEWLNMAVYEYCPNGDLFSFTKRNPAVVRNVNFLKNLFVGLLSGLAAISEAGFVHCDIKPENILLDSDLTPKIGDFGAFKKAGQKISLLMRFC
jgi:serine/threonine protein kinase